MENTATMKVQVLDPSDDGVICVDAKKFTSIIKALGDLPVSFYSNGTSIVLRTNSGKYNLSGVDATQYPNPVESYTEMLTIPGAILANGFNRTKWAVGNDKIRPQMKGVYFNILADKIVFCATDTRKLCKYEVKKETAIEPKGLIIPGKAANLIPTLFGECEDVKVDISDTSVIFSEDGVVLTTRLCKGNFPAYERVIPAQTDHTLTTDRKSLIAALNRVAIFAADTNGLIEVKTTADKIEILSKDFNNALSGSEVLIGECDMDSLRMGFSCDYLAQTLGSLGDEDVTFGINDASRPAKFVESDSMGEYTAILMPMTLNNE